MVNRLDELRAMMTAAALTGLLLDPRYSLSVEEATSVALRHGDMTAKKLVELERGLTPSEEGL